ncbi:MAG: membrane protein insertase YidC [Bacteroidetes bacterium]|nr:membrane protein insertase YidC [Bacteroidota bacterium]MBK9412352.1 membrane protein insertase YidC [Bacteroidota bacterium]MBL0031742.1 membrane protein insertase YidC [Bacteroidota bacterium]
MDKNSIMGLSIIGLIIIAYSIYTQPSVEEVNAAKMRRDSIERVQTLAKEAAIVAEQKNQIVIPDSTTEISDSVKVELEKQKFGDFASASQGVEQILTLENNLVKVSLSSKGGKIKSVQLKDYKTWDGRPLYLMNNDSNVFNLSLSAQNRIINTEELYFTASGTAGSKNSVNLRLPAGDKKYIEFAYSLPENSYMVNYQVNVVGLEDVIAQNSSFINVDWKDIVTQQEKSITNERAATSIHYRFTDEEVDYISETKNEKKDLKTRVQWIAFKQQFFSAVLISDQSGFESPTVETKSDENSKQIVKEMTAAFSLPYDRKPVQTYNMQFYFGPNNYQDLKKIDNLHLEKLIPLGWGIFGWVNRFLVIPTFHFLDGFNMNYGLIILILTILVRIIILPLTYGSFKSQAKMKVLSPEMAEINEKFGSDPMKKQQETMALYRKAGVNPLGGCIPGLLQLPILIAMFRFFPSSIELRQQSFLWAHDLSTYDSILDLPFHIPAYGSHVSLFTLLMTVSTIIYTKMNMQMTAATNPQMKWMMYLMPILFLGFFNNYSAGLSYYYFLSNVIGFGQQYLFKAFLDEDKIHAQIQENKKKPVKKSGFQARLEQMAKERNAQVGKRK